MLVLAVISKGQGRLHRLKSEAEMHENPDNEFVHYWELPQVAIETENDVHFSLDGEPTLPRRLKFSVLPRQLGLVV